MSHFLSVSQETLRAAQSGREREKDTDTKLKNAKSRTEIPAWLVTYGSLVGNDSSIGSNNTAEEELNQANSNTENDNNNSPLPNWLVTFHNTVGFE